MMLLTNSKNMWPLGAVLAVIICVLCHTASSTEINKVEEEVREAWKLHVAEFHDGNADFLSRPDRFRAFRKSFGIVKSHNERYAAGEETFAMKLNYRSAFVPDDNPLLPPEKGVQAARLLLDGLEGGCGTSRCRRPSRPNLNSTFSWKGNLPVKEPQPAGDFVRSHFRETKFRYASIPAGRLPARVDWRPLFDKIRNQHRYCGNCWAVSSTAAIESAIKIATGKFVQLSIQQPTNCSPGRDIPGPGWEGGWPEKHLEWVAQHKEMAVEETNSTVSSRAPNQTCGRYQTVDVNVTAYGYLPRASVAALKAAVSVQPIVVYIKAEDSLEHYGGGVYSPRRCGNEVNHAVLLVGYGTDRKSGKGYWIVQNSWGEAWGEGGYFRVAMTKEGSQGVCGMLAREPVFPIVRGPSWNPCLFRPCGGGTCKPSSSMPGGFTCTSCPRGFYVHTNSDATQTCAPDPCQESYVCGPGKCKFDPDARHGYTCQCRGGTGLGVYTTGAPTCTRKSARVYALQAGDTCEGLASRNSFTLKAFKCINPNLDCSKLKPGQLVSLGNLVPTPECTSIYTTGGEGETCETVQEKFGLSEDRFGSLNPGFFCPIVLPIYWQLCVEGGTSAALRTVGATRASQTGCDFLVTDRGDNCNNFVRKARPRAFRQRLTTEDIIILNTAIIRDIVSFCRPSGRIFHAGTELCVRPLMSFSGFECLCTIQSAIGDTSLTISIREQIPLKDLLQNNPDINFDLLEVGQLVCVE